MWCIYTCYRWEKKKTNASHLSSGEKVRFVVYISIYLHLVAIWIYVNQSY